MKYMNIIKLLSVLLCIGMLLTACAAKDGDSETTGEAPETSAPAEQPAEIPDEALLEGVEAKLENFFKLDASADSSLSTAIRPLNKVDSATKSGKLVVYETRKIDAQNNVTETYDIFNTDEGKVVLTLTSTYANGDYDTFDWDNLIVKEHLVDKNADPDEYIFEAEKDKNYPSNVMSVSVEGSVINYIVVKKATVTSIDEQTRKANPEGAVYEIATTYTYYDIAGAKIAEFNYEPNVNCGYTTAFFGNVKAIFDEETGKLIKSYNYELENKIGSYDYETEKYGYFFNESEAGEFIEVYNKQTEQMLYRYHLDINYISYNLFLLHNGDMLIQYSSTVVDEGDPYDFYDASENAYKKYAHEIFDVTEGKATKIELPFLVNSLAHGEDMADVYKADGITVTENVRNIAKVTPIENKLMGDSEVMVFDNNMSVLFELERIIPEHSFDGAAYPILGFKLLASGEYLVNLSTTVPATKAIVKPDGTVRSYIKSGWTVADGFVYDNAAKVIYDYDLNILYKLVDDDRKYDREYDFVNIIGGNIVLKVKDADNMGVKYVFEKAENSSGYTIKSLFDGKKVEFQAMQDNYFTVKDEAGRYILYNASFEHMLTSENAIAVYEMEDYFVVETYSSVLGQYIIYTVKE